MWKDFRNSTPENGAPAMDHDKPQAISTYADEAVFSEDRTVSPLTVDVDYARHPSLDEPVIIEEKRERRGEALWYVFFPFHKKAELTSIQENAERKAY